MPSQSRHNSTIPASAHKPLSLASVSLSTPPETRTALLNTRPYKSTTNPTYKPKAYATTVPEGKNLAEWLEISKILDSWIEVVGSEWSGSGSGDDGEAEDEEKKAITEKDRDEMKRERKEMVEYWDSRRYVKTRSRQTSHSKRLADRDSKRGHRIEHQRNRQTSCGDFTQQLVERKKYGSDKRRNGKSESQIRGVNPKRQLGTGKDNVKLEILSDVSCDHHTPEATYEKSQNNGTPQIRYESASDGKVKEKALLLLHDTGSFMTNVHSDSKGTKSDKRPTNKEDMGDTPDSPYRNREDTDISALGLQRSPRSTESYQQSAKMNSESDSMTRSESRSHRGSENLRQKVSSEYRAYSPKKYRPLKDLQNEQNQASYTRTEYLPANITPAKSNMMDEYTAVQEAPDHTQPHKHCTFTRTETADTASSNITISQPKLSSEETTPELSEEQKNEDTAKLPAESHCMYPTSIEEPLFQPSITLLQAPGIPAYTTTEKILEQKLKQIEELRKEVAEYLAAAEDLAEKQAANKGRVCCLHGIPCSCEFSSIHHRLISGNNAEKAKKSRDISIPDLESCADLHDVLSMEVDAHGKGPDARVHVESDIHKTQRSLEQVHPTLFAADTKDKKAALQEYNRDLYIPPSLPLHETHPAFRNNTTKTEESDKQSINYQDKEEEETNANTSPPHAPASPPHPIPTTHNHSPTPTATEPTPTPIRRPSKLRRIRAITNLRSTHQPTPKAHPAYTREFSGTAKEKVREKEKEKGKLRRAYLAAANEKSDENVAQD
ncbi:hypothetical protein BZA77DRAFT_356849 [Pyronema omphalodes]|nr:hypothetical protein BZA77DRAFT_357633 [Pyronema omphalodes]KAI5814327.1 hypothetical protein BZA77DRAFT_356849 [Pyronema omphalodes]